MFKITSFLYKTTLQFPIKNQKLTLVNKPEKNGECTHQDSGWTKNSINRERKKNHAHMRQAEGRSRCMRRKKKSRKKEHRTRGRPAGHLLACGSPKDWLGSCSPLRPCRHGWDGYIRSEAVDTSRRPRPTPLSMRLAGDQHHAQPLAVHPPSAATCFAAGGAVPLYPLP